MGFASRMPRQRAQNGQDESPLGRVSGSLRNRALAEAKSQWLEPHISRETWSPWIRRRSSSVVFGWDLVISEHRHASDENLREALTALERLDELSQKEGYQPCSDEAKQTAARLLRRLHAPFPRQYEVYPTDQREVAIDIPGDVGRGVLILCDSAGGAGCFVTLSGDNRRARYNDAARLPDGFLLEALAEL